MTCVSHMCVPCTLSSARPQKKDEEKQQSRRMVIIEVSWKFIARQEKTSSFPASGQTNEHPKLMDNCANCDKWHRVPSNFSLAWAQSLSSLPFLRASQFSNFHFRFIFLSCASIFITTTKKKEMFVLFSDDNFRFRFLIFTFDFND